MAKSDEEEKKEQEKQQNRDQQVPEAENNKPTAPDVILDIPELKVEKIKVRVRNLEARVALNARVTSMVKVGVGAQVHIGKVDVDIERVKAQAHLRIRLERVKALVNRTVETLDRNPQLIKAILKPVAEGVEKTGEDVGEGAGGLISNLGNGLGEVVDGVGEGAKNVAEKAGQTVTDNALADEIKDKLPGTDSKD